MQVIVPARTNSRRVPNKNFRLFACGKSLFQIKMEQLLGAQRNLSVCVSCEDEEMRYAVEEAGGTFMLRHPYYTTPEGERNLLQVLTHQASELPQHPADDGSVMLVSVTDPFFDEFAKVCDVWQRVKHQHDSLMVVRKLTDQVLYGDGAPANFDYFGQPTQFLKGWYTVSMCALVTTRDVVHEVGHYIGKRPYLFVTRTLAADIDTQDEFTRAAAIWESTHGGLASR